MEDLPVWKAGQLVKSPAFQFYPKQLLGDDLWMAMDWDAKGMHWTLCCISWQQEPPGSVPNDMPLISRWLGSPSDDVWRRVRPQIFAAWSLDDGRWYQSGMVRAWDSQQKRRQAGSANVRIRYQPSTNELVTPMKIEVEKEVAVAFEVRSPTDEELIYCEYPRKVKPREAFKAIGNATKRLLAGEPDAPRFDSRDDVTVWLRQRVQAYAKAREGQEKQFTPYPASWFNSGSYLEQEETWYVERNNGKPSIEAKQRASLQTLSRAASAAFGGTHGRGPVAVPKLPAHGSSAETVAGGLAGDRQGLRPRKVSESTEAGLPEVEILPPASRD